MIFPFDITFPYIIYILLLLLQQKKGEKTD